jgi:hypothetical protein
MGEMAQIIGIFFFVQPETLSELGVSGINAVCLNRTILLIVGQIDIKNEFSFHLQHRYQEKLKKFKDKWNSPP